MKVAELAGAQLALWVARAEGLGRPEIIIGACVADGYEEYAPHEDWAQGGPIIDREGVAIFKGEGVWAAQVRGVDAPYWIDTSTNDEITGPTALIAAMRAYVASKFGDTVPDE